MGGFGGWYKAWRDMPRSQAGRRGVVYVGVMHWLLCRAEWQEGEDLEPGQLRASVSELADEMGLSRFQLHRILASLVKDGFLKMEASGKGRGASFLMTVLNYSEYQSRTIPAQLPHNSATIAEQLSHTLSLLDKGINDGDKFYCDTISAQFRDELATIAARFEAARVQEGKKEEFKTESEKTRAGEAFRAAGQSSAEAAGVRYPSSAAEVLAAAAGMCLRLSEAEAEEFLAHYQSIGWQTRNGVIVNWRPRLLDWKRLRERMGRAGGDNGNGGGGRLPGGRIEPGHDYSGTRFTSVAEEFGNG